MVEQKPIASVGSRIACTYHDKPREGKIERIGREFVTLEVSPGQYRTFRYDEMSDLKVIE